MTDNEALQRLPEAWHEAYFERLAIMLESAPQTEAGTVRQWALESTIEAMAERGVEPR